MPSAISGSSRRASRERTSIVTRVPRWRTAAPAPSRRSRRRGRASSQGGVELHRGRGGQVAATGQAGDVGDVRLGAGGDEVMRGLDAPSVDVQCRPFDEACVAADELEAVLGRKVHVLLLPHRLDDLALAGDQRREVDGARVVVIPGNRCCRRASGPRPRRAAPWTGCSRCSRTSRRRVAFDHHDAQVPAARGDAAANAPPPEPTMARS